MIKRTTRSMIKLAYGAVLMVTTIMASSHASPASGEQVYRPPLNEATLSELRDLYKKLIDAENLHDLATVKAMLLASPDSLFISRVEPVEKGDWGGYWGTTSIMGHFAALYDGTFRIDPNYAEQKVVGLSPDVAETYVPVIITSGYGGQAPVGRRFLMVLDWVRTSDGWRVATDIPMPISPPSPINK
jgi:hypothetical protein